MVSGNIAHLFGYVYETSDVKYELEVKFDEDFPNTPPQLLFHDQIKELLGEVRLESLDAWSSDNSVVSIMHELKDKIQQATHDPTQEPVIVEEIILKPTKESESTIPIEESEEYITPDLNTYPSEVHNQDYITPSNVYGDYSSQPSFEQQDSLSSNLQDTFIPEEEALLESEETSLEVETELSLIQQAYAYDQRGKSKANINVYITITITKTFIVGVNLTMFPKRPALTLPNEIQSLLGNPNQSLSLLKNWNEKNPPHIVDVLHELETRLFLVKDIEQEVKKISGEYKCDHISGNIAQLKVHLLTYGFKKYLLDIDLSPFPRQPIVHLTSELQEIVGMAAEELNSVKNWKEKHSEVVEIIREISWLVDKNSRINFEIALLRDHYKEIEYDTISSNLRIAIKGKMQSEDIVFQFEIHLPREYPLKLPEIKVLNEFEIESREKIKDNLHASFDKFFDKWTPFTYLVDLFDAISKNIFEVSVVSCVICHKLDCPSCSNKIAGSNSCHIECPYCERAYHEHCWNQTIISFGKCGFCLKTPPPEMMP